MVEKDFSMGCNCFPFAWVPRIKKLKFHPSVQETHTINLREAIVSTVLHKSGERNFSFHDKTTSAVLVHLWIGVKCPYSQISKYSNTTRKDEETHREASKEDEHELIIINK